jgi:tRNA (guanine-N7-)-methyltransferase
MSDSRSRRRIRSFVRREGRLTPGQERALNELLPRYGVAEDDGIIDLDALFGRCAPRTLEIGFGDGESLASMAAAEPEVDFLGLEVHRPGVGRLLQRLEEQGLGNVRVIGQDAVEVLEKRIADASLDRVLLFFPDPWHKKRHHKRRILNPEFADLLARKIRSGGVFHAATDWRDYAEQMLEVMDACAGFDNINGPGRYAARPEYRIETKFERRGRRLGHGVWDLLYRRR